MQEDQRKRARRSRFVAEDARWTWAWTTCRNALARWQDNEVGVVMSSSEFYSTSHALRSSTIADKRCRPVQWQQWISSCSTAVRRMQGFVPDQHCSSPLMSLKIHMQSRHSFLTLGVELILEGELQTLNDIAFVSTHFLDVAPSIQEIHLQHPQND